MPIVPDDKNWTWVLERRCPECDFDASTFDPATTAAVVEANAIEFERLLQDPHASERPVPNWDQDETAIAERYREQDPHNVAGELRASAFLLAARFATVRGDLWQRTGFRLDGAAFTVDSFARYLVHDPVHHLWDVQRGYAALAG